MAGYAISEMIVSDWQQVRSIYEEGIATGHSTFERSAPGWEAWDSAHLRQPRLVAREGGSVVGWCALSPISRRSVYAGVTELNLYVRADRRGRGIGSALLRALIEASERAGVWSLQATIFPENASSLALHRASGFRDVGRRERLGRMAHGPLIGTWRDVLLLERRSSVVGIDEPLARSPVAVPRPIWHARRRMG